MLVEVFLVFLDKPCHTFSFLWQGRRSSPWSPNLLYN